MRRPDQADRGLGTLHGLGADGKRSDRQAFRNAGKEPRAAGGAVAGVTHRLRPPKRNLATGLKDNIELLRYVDRNVPKPSARNILSARRQSPPQI